MNTTQELFSASLFYREGGSDKEYHVRIEASGEGYVVNFAFGRRGTALSIGTKTQTPVSYEAAVKIFEKLIAEKKSKGYTPSEDGKAFAMTDKAGEVSGMLPQLLNEIEEAELTSYLNDDAWAMEEKFDGRRLLVRAIGGKVEGANRKGLLVSLPKEVEETLSGLDDFILDGELVGSKYWVFDILSYQGKDLTLHNFRTRCYWRGLLRFADPRTVEMVHTYWTTEEKLGAYRTLQESLKEGVVFKRGDAPYTAGRPKKGGDQVKFKFVKTCTARISKINAQRSVGLEMEGTFIGNVMIPPNFEVPPVGATVEIRYLYYNQGGSLYQPVYLGERDDIDPDACKLSQLKSNNRD